MTRRRTPPATANTTDSLIADVFRSPEYLESLKSRLLSGSAKASEILLARELGLVIPVNDGQDERRAALRAMPPDVRRVFADLLRLTQTDGGRLKVIRAGSITGLGWDTAADPVPVVPRSIIEPTTEPQTEIDDLLPRKVPA